MTKLNSVGNRQNSNCNLSDGEENNSEETSCSSRSEKSVSPSEENSVTELDDTQDDHQTLVTDTRTSHYPTWVSYLLGIDAVMFLHGIGYQGMQVIVQNFYIDRICRISENFTEEICDTLLQNATTEKLVELTASDYVVYQTSVEMVLPIIFAFFLGPYTDKHGTKPFIILSLLGYILSALMYIVAFYLPVLPPYYILICSIPIALTGGIAVFVISTFGYVMKNSSPENVSLRLTNLGILWDLGCLVGCLAGPEIFKLDGFLPVFIMGSCAYSIAMGLTVIFIRDKSQPEIMIANVIRNAEETESDSHDIICSTNSASKYKDLFGSFSICFKRREGSIRRIILSLAICLPLQLLAYCSKTTYQYLYVRSRYGWDEVIYSYYSATTGLISTIGGVFISVIFINWLKLKDIYIVTINVLSNMFGYVIFGFSTLGWHMYLGSAIQMLGSTTPAVLRSMLSKLVPIDEQGKLLTFVSCLELCMPMLASGIYREIYTRTISTFAGAIFITASLFHLTILLTLLTVWKSFHRLRSYLPIVMEE